MFYRRICFLIALLFCSAAVFAQSKAEISGTVTDGVSNSPIEFANVQLLKAADSSIIKATASDKKGKFTLDNIAEGNYVLLCTFISYNKVKLPITIKPGEKKLNTGIIKISSLSQTMNEVIVTTKKSILNTSIDRKIYNVGQDIMAQSGSAADILKNVPSVEVDIDGGVTLRGSPEVMILIDGKPSPLMGKTRAEVLQQLPANSIERIEVITNPSARFKPDGTAGIINIVMKKNLKSGWNGTLTGNAGNNKRYNGNVNLNYKTAKINVFGSYGIRQDSRQRLNIIDREEIDSAGHTVLFYNEQNASPARPLSHLFSAGTEYNLDEHNSIGISGNHSHRDQTKNDVANKYYYSPNHILTRQYDRLRYDPEYEIESDATVFWQHNFKKEDHEIRFEYNRSWQDELEDNNFTNKYTVPIAVTTFDNTLIRQTSKENHITADYSNALSENAKLELGYDGSFNVYDPVFYGEYFDASQQKFVKDITKSNKFIYDQKLNAVYGTYQRSYKAFGYSAGLRGEQTNIIANLVTKDSVLNNSYFKFYPTIHFDYKVKNGDIQLNYSRRVRRPEADDLNPFPEYADPRNLRAGNPKLLPEIINSIELGYKWQNENYSFVPSLYYRYKQNGFTQVTVKLNDSTFLTTQQNLSNDKSAGLELIFSARPAKFMQANISSNIFYNVIDASDLGFAAKRSVISMSTNFNTTFTITKNTMMQISSNYRSARLTPQGKSYGTFVFNSGIRQDLFKKKLSVTLTGSDLFKTLREKRELNTPFLKQLSIGRRDAQIFYLGLAFHFGKNIKKSTEEKLQFDNAL
ncbi:MAG TPA: TonB-dependent receptor [Chitinophagaceae bacterium]|nr:TonB-dependent receptor [Chitinophagaceae bacterium]